MMTLSRQHTHRGAVSRLALLASLLVVSLSSTVTRAQVACPARERELVTELGVRVRQGVSFGPGETEKRIPQQARPNTRYVRVRVEASDFGRCDNWILTVRDTRFHVIQTLGKDAFAASSVRWTSRVEGEQARIELTRCEPGHPTIRLDESIVMPDKATSFYSSESDNDPAWVDLYTATDDVRRFGDAVGMFLSSWEDDAWVCSGVMVAPTLLMTNWHCGGPRHLADDFMWNDLVVKGALVDLSWDDDRVSREFLVKGKIVGDKNLDFVLLRLTAIDQRGPVQPVAIRRKNVTHHEPVRLVHHPLGLRKQISLQHCEVDASEFDGWTGKPKTEFTHRCDSDAGSSGGPVFDTDGALVGLHHLGYKYDQQCVPDERNKAVRIAEILDFLKREHERDATRTAWLEIAPYVR